MFEFARVRELFAQPRKCAVEECQSPAAIERPFWRVGHIGFLRQSSFRLRGIE